MPLLSSSIGRVSGATSKLLRFQKEGDKEEEATAKRDPVFIIVSKLRRQLHITFGGSRRRKHVKSTFENYIFMTFERTRRSRICKCS